MASGIARSARPRGGLVAMPIMGPTRASASGEIRASFMLPSRASTSSVVAAASASSSGLALTPTARRASAQALTPSSSWPRRWATMASLRCGGARPATSSVKARALVSQSLNVVGATMPGMRSVTWPSGVIT